MNKRVTGVLVIGLLFGLLLGCDSGVSDGPANASVADISDGGLDVSNTGQTPTDGSISRDGGNEVLREINSVLPNRIPKTGGSSLRLIGLGFEEGMVISIGQYDCSEVVVQSPTQATCVTPALPVGSKDLVIRWPLQGAFSALSDGIEVYEPLVLTGIQPSRGHVSGGQLSWISGAGFTDNARVFVADRRAEIVRVVDNGQSMRIQLPPGEPGSATIRVENLNGRAELDDGFEYYEPLAVDEITPRVAGPDGLERVIIRGNGLSEEAVVLFGDLEAEVIASLLSRQRLDVRLPPSSQSGLVDVVVESLGQRVVVENGFAFVQNVDGEARLDSVVPRRLPVNTFTTIYLAGSGFTESLEVTIAGRPLECLVLSTFSVSCSVNSMVVGTEMLEVRDPATQLAGQVELDFFLDVNVFSITPDYGSQAGGTLVEIEGHGFSADTQFFLGTSPINLIEVTNERALGTTSFSQPGRVDLHVESGGDQAMLVGAFEYLDPALSLGGVTGEEIGRNLNVTVLDAYTSEPLIGAQVVVQALSSDALWRAETDERGQVTLGDEALVLPVAVTAAFPGYFTETLNRVTSEDTTLIMIPTQQEPSESSNNEEQTDPYPVIRGYLEGLDALRKPDESGVVVAAFIESSTIFDGFGNPINPIPQPFLMVEDGPFEFLVEPGEFAVIATAGYLEAEAVEAYRAGALDGDALRDSLQPIQMGLARHIMVDMGDERDDISVRLTVPMRASVAVEFDNPPGGGNGPNRFTLDVSLDLETDGFYDLRFFQSKTTPTFEISTMPDISGLSSVGFSWVGEAIKVPAISLGGLSSNAELRTRSTSWMNTSRNEDRINFGPFVGTLEMGPRPLLRTAAVEMSWEPHLGYTGRQAEVADCHLVILYSDYEPVWLTVVPGAATELDLPLLLAGEGGIDVITGNEVLHGYIESYLFRGEFSYSDFNLYDVLGVGNFASTAVIFEQL